MDPQDPRREPRTPLGLLVHHRLEWSQPGRGTTAREHPRDRPRSHSRTRGGLRLHLLQARAGTPRRWCRGDEPLPHQRRYARRGAPHPRTDPRGAQRCAGFLRDLRVHQPALTRRRHLAGVHPPTQDLPHASPAAGADAHGRVQLPRTPGRGQGPARPRRRVRRGGQGGRDRTRTRTHPR